MTQSFKPDSDDSGGTENHMSQDGGAPTADAGVEVSDLPGIITALGDPDAVITEAGLARLFGRCSNSVKRAVVLEREDVILEELRGGSNNTHETGAALEKLIDDLEGKAGEMPLREVGRLVAQEAERATINQVLGHTHWNRKQAARLLNVSYKTLLQKIRYCGLEPG